MGRRLSPTLACVAAIQVFRLDFWMRHYGAPSMKPTMVVTNQRVLADLDLGPVPKRKRKAAKATTKKYTDGGGKPRFSGTKRLKASQKLGKHVYVC